MTDDAPSLARLTLADDGTLLLVRLAAIITRGNEAELRTAMLAAVDRIP